jgi:hypothetical protein
LHSIHEKLEEIRVYLEKEIAFKQHIIDGQEEQIGQLKVLAEDKDLTVRQMNDQLQECRQTNEGTRQLINKLLNDISNYQKDIEWYKRTYVKRSLWGYLKERFMK